MVLRGGPVVVLGTPPAVREPASTERWRSGERMRAPPERIWRTARAPGHAAVVATDSVNTHLDGLRVDDSDDDDPILYHADGTPVDTWREDYPYDARLPRAEYEQAKRLLQIELLKLQNWIKGSGERLVVLFEGRDAAGKGQAPEFERMLVRDGIHLVKFWFSVSQGEQRTRFTIRQVDPVRQWKFSPMDAASLDKWDDYTEAKEAMFFYTDTADAPWTVVRSNDKKRARLEAMRHVLARFAYDDKDAEIATPPDPLIVGSAAILSEHRVDPHRVLPRLT